MKWHEIAVHTSEEASEIISHFFHELGAGGVAIEESDVGKPRDTSLGQWYDLPLNDLPEGTAVIRGYFPEMADADAILARLKDKVAELAQYGIDAGQPRWDVRIVDEEDWANAWKAYYKPIRVSDRLTVKPTWETYAPREGEVVIELDPGMAFGTGTHATTALCLRALERVVRPGDRVIDVGTGSGILAVAAAKLGASRVLALDLDPVAVSSATDNVRLNGLAHQVTVMQSDLLGAVESAPSTELPVNVVVANILAEIIVTFVDDVKRVLADGGWYVVSGVISVKEREVTDSLERAGFAVERVDRQDDWVAITARKHGGRR